MGNISFAMFHRTVSCEYRCLELVSSADLTLFPLELHVFACVTYLLRLTYPRAADALDSDIFLFWSASPVVSVVALAMCVHEFGRGASEGALKAGVYLFGC